MSPTLSLTPLSGSAPTEAASRQSHPAAARLGSPVLAPLLSTPPPPVGPPPRSLLTRRAPGQDTCPLQPETQNAPPFSRPSEDPHLPPSQTGPSRPPSLQPGVPSHRVPAPPGVRSHPHFPPGPRGLAVRPNFSGRGPVPAAAGIPVWSGDWRTGSRPLCPRPPRRHELRSGPAPRPGLGRQPGAEAEPAWREPRCPGARSPRPPAAPLPAHLPAGAGAAHLLACRRRHCREYVAVAAVARAPRLASPLLSAPARAAQARRTTAPGALCRREAESSRPNPNSPAAPARTSASAHRLAPGPAPGPAGSQRPFRSRCRRAARPVSRADLGPPPPPPGSLP